MAQRVVTRRVGRSSRKARPVQKAVKERARVRAVSSVMSREETRVVEAKARNRRVGGAESRR